MSNIYNNSVKARYYCNQCFYGHTTTHQNNQEDGYKPRSKLERRARRPQLAPGGAQSGTAALLKGNGRRVPLRGVRPGGRKGRT
eukprot:6480919-Pyramimonas_sp.AAC.1